MFTKEHILAEIRRTAAQNGGKPLGTERFRAETGIKTSDWQGKIGVRWNDAIVEAGFQPNQLQGQRTDEDLLECLALLVREIGHFPVVNEIRLKAHTDTGFPWHSTFARFGGKEQLAARLREFCVERNQEDVATLCEAIIRAPDKAQSISDGQSPGDNEPEIGYVYLMRSGRYSKIGCTNAVGRRERELAIQLPEAVTVVHTIKTDDPAGIENYWHRRFADRRKNSEWFELSGSDVKAFKRRKFM